MSRASAEALTQVLSALGLDPREVMSFRLEILPTGHAAIVWESRRQVDGETAAAVIAQLGASR